MDVPKLSIIYPVHGNWAQLRRSLDALGCLNKRPRTQIVVVDDASRDGGAAQLIADRPELQVVVRARNGGFAAAVNDGLRHCTAEIIAVLNSDLIISPQDLAQLAETVSENSMWIVGPHTVDPSGRTTPTARQWQTIGRMLAEYFIPLRLVPCLDRRLRDIDYDALEGERTRAVDWLVGSCLVFHRRLMDDVGFLDESFFMNSEELDWQRRSAAAGYRSVFVPFVRATHGGGMSSGQGDNRFLWVWQARLKYVRKWEGATAAALLRAGMFAAFALSLPVWMAGWLFRPDRRRQIRRQVRRHALALTIADPVLPTA